VAQGGPDDERADAALLARAARGDEQALAALVIRHGDVLRRIAWRILRHSAEAEDVAQEAFVRLWQEAGRIRAATARGWLIQVASRLAFARLRRRAPEFHAQLPDTAAAEDTARPLAEAEAARILERALARLPDRQRLVLVLVYLEGLDQRAAAEALELSRAALDSLLARARDGLRGLLGDEGRDLMASLMETDRP
jgi:RNA polymerase sigma-70 factor (ECF subfamily)